MNDADAWTHFAASALNGLLSDIKMEDRKRMQAMGQDEFKQRMGEAAGTLADQMILELRKRHAKPHPADEPPPPYRYAVLSKAEADEAKKKC